MDPSAILQLYQLGKKQLSIHPFGSGLINNTWKVDSTESRGSYILQRINSSVFNNPQAIDHNIMSIAKYLQRHFPEYLFMAPLQTREGASLIFDKDSGYFRLFQFLEGSRSFEVLDNPSQAFEAARQFARFTRLLSGLDASALQTTIPDFHNLLLRYQQFLFALETGNRERIIKASPLIEYLKKQKQVSDEFESIKKNKNFKIRVTHHDTKISNVLFDQNGNGLCVIDLDTVMPGYFISDVGDMMRTYLSPVSEEEKDFEKIEIREDYFSAIVKGYLEEMKEELTEPEKKCFVYAGKFMIYMQALRFLTDHLQNDVYYGASYEGQNLVRAENQIRLLQKLIDKEDALHRIVIELK